MKQEQGPEFYAGIDGGATKTLAVVVDAHGNERGRGQSGSSNYHTVGRDQAVSNIRSALEEAARTAGCQLPLRAAWLGVAGIDRPGDSEALLPAIQHLELARLVRLTNDAELALSVLDGAIGVAAIAGTGSIALGRDQHGASARAGGWGHIIGDEGSGYDIGRQGLQAAARAADGRGPMTSLLDRIMKYWSLGSPSDILGQVYPAEDKAKIAALATLVFEAARSGDEVALKIIERAASDIALAAVAVGNALNFGDRPMNIALTGGLLVHEANFQALVLRRIRRRRAIGQVAIVEQPALGAARAAVQLATMSGDWAHTAESTL